MTRQYWPWDFVRALRHGCKGAGQGISGLTTTRNIPVHSLDVGLVTHGTENVSPIFGVVLRNKPRAGFQNSVAAMVAAVSNYPVHLKSSFLINRYFSP